MKRQIVYYGALPQDTDLTNSQKNAYIGLAKLAAAILGTNTIFHNLAAAPGSGLNVSIGPGEVFSLQNVDNAAYGSLASDTAHQILKQGVNLDSTTLSVPAPGTSGQSINYLIEAQFQEVDGGSQVLPYYNSANPTVALSGQNNNGQAQYTYRDNIVALQVKAGTAAATGSQTTPAADSGWTGLYVVTVAYGATSVSQANISTVAGAPFLTEALGDKISTVTGDLRYAALAGSSAQVFNVANATQSSHAINQGQMNSTISGLNLKSMSQQASNAVTITGGTLTGVSVSSLTTALAIADGGTGATTAVNARSNLGLGSVATQNANAVAITGGLVDNVPIGQTTPAAITGSSVSVSGNGQYKGSLSAGDFFFGNFGNSAGSAFGISKTGQTLLSFDYTSGKATFVLGMENTPIGQNTPATVKATSVVADRGLANSVAPVHYFASINSDDSVTVEFRQGRYNRDVLVASSNQTLAASFFKAIENGNVIFTVGSGGVGSFSGPVAVGAPSLSGHAVQLGQFTSSLGTSGWRKLPNGDIEQWGTTASLAAASSSAITFPIAFPNACFNVVATRKDTSGTSQGSDYTTSWSKTGFTMFNDSPSAAAPFSWRAIGN